MSTRATYRFEAGDVSPRASGMRHAPVTLYIHHDGYPEGAAAYFWDMHHVESYDRTPLVCFIRANERAEVTDGHDAHGDTQYRYTLRGSFLSVSKRYMGAGESNWQGFYTGEWHEFVNQYGRESIEGFTPLRAIESVYGYNGNDVRIYSRKQILAGLIKAREELLSYRERFPTYTGNIAGHESTVKGWERALDSYHSKDPEPVVVSE